MVRLALLRMTLPMAVARPLHRDVTSATLAYLRGRVERASVRSMNERAELIRCFYPAKFNIESKTGEGDIP